MVKKGMFIGERYEIIDKVGSGGMSDVYKAKDHKLGRFVAIKVLKQEFSEDKSFVSKFKIEAQSAAGLAHPNIVNIFDVGEDNGLYYIVMELIEGITLKTYINRKGKLPVKEAVSIAVQVAQGIEAAHNNHIIHRDIKPQNIMISREGKVKVTDFGIARAASTNTINSNAMGSVHYISPEQARNGYVDEKSDIYSLGISLYEMITGKVPFEGDSTVTIALQHVQDELPPMSNFVDNVPISVEKIVEKCTQKKPDRRYLKVSSLIADLKKSLVTPDEDFVQLIPAGTSSSMVMISEDEVNVIKKDAGIDVLLADIEKDDDEPAPKKTADIDVRDKDAEDDFDEFDGQNQRVDKIVTIGSIVAAVVIILAAVLIFGKFLGGCSNGKNPGTVTTTTPDNGVTNDSSIDAKQTNVPSLVGRTVDDAMELLSENTLEGKVVEYRKDNNVEKGRVIEQEIAAGTIVDKHSTVNIIVSDGADDVEIEDVKGLTKEAAEKKLKTAGLDVSSEFQLNDEVEAGLVIATNPEAGKTVKYGSKITIYVSQGKDTKVEVPNVTNMAVEAAEVMLNERGLAINIANEIYDDKIPKGQVINQDIKAGSIIDLATSSNVVGVTVSLGKKPEETTTEPKMVAIFPSITALSNVPELTDTEKENAYLTATISYTDKLGTQHSEDISSSLNGYSAEKGQTPYTDDWTQSQLKFTLDVSEGAEIVMIIKLNYTTDDGVMTSVQVASKTAVAQ